MKNVILCILIIQNISLTICQSLLFPHGYFDMNKLSAIDAFYLNMLAQANLEYGGTTIEELNEYSRSRFPKDQKDDKTKDEGKKGNAEKSLVNKLKTPKVDEDEKVKNPFNLANAFKVKRASNAIRRKPSIDNNSNELAETSTTATEEDPFINIATRPPKRQLYQHKGQQLNRNSIMTRNRYNRLKLFYSTTTKLIPAPPTTTQSPKKMDPEYEDYHRPLILALPLPPSL